MSYTNQLSFFISHRVYDLYPYTLLCHMYIYLLCYISIKTLYLVKYHTERNISITVYNNTFIVNKIGIQQNAIICTWRIRSSLMFPLLQSEKFMDYIKRRIYDVLVKFCYHLLKFVNISFKKQINIFASFCALENQYKHKWCTLYKFYII